MKCPTCNSPAPHLHPAVQVGGEVETCIDGFHLEATSQNTPSIIAEVNAKRRAKELSEAYPSL